MLLEAQLIHFLLQEQESSSRQVLRSAGRAWGWRLWRPKSEPHPLSKEAFHQNLHLLHDCQCTREFTTTYSWVYEAACLGNKTVSAIPVAHSTHVFPKSGDQEQHQSLHQESELRNDYLVLLSADVMYSYMCSFHRPWNPCVSAADADDLILSHVCSSYPELRRVASKRPQSG